ncbi:YdcF family protein [bacterium]|nr:YdcF family protein [bacterium]
MKLLVALGKRLNNDGSFRGEMLERCNAVLQGLSSGAYDTAILSGGMANPKAGITEAQAMCDYLTQKGIAQDRLILEGQSKTTRQNAKYSAKLIIELGAKKIYLCSSACHLNRPILNPVRLFRFYLGKSVDIEPIVANA